MMLETTSATRRRGQALPLATLFDRTGVRAKIAALHSGRRSADAARPDVLAVFRNALETGRTRIRLALEANGGGLACAGQLSYLEDELIEAIHHYVSTYVHPSPTGGKGKETSKSCAVVAVGGYGRATLAPGSDIDLLFLLPDAASPRAQSIAQSILYILWDLGQKIGHSTRTIEECLDEARGDFTVRTALLEARLLLGDAALFETLRARFESEIVRATAAEFVAAKLAERDARIGKAGRSRYLVEPHVKDGKGGLRDLNTLFWIAKYF